MASMAIGIGIGLTLGAGGGVRAPAGQALIGANDNSTYYTANDGSYYTENR